MRTMTERRRAKIEKVLSDFYQSTGIAATLYDVKETIVAKSPVYSGFCSHIRTREACIKKCDSSNLVHMKAVARDAAGRAGEVAEEIAFVCARAEFACSFERAREQAEEIGNTFFREVAFLTVHSVLHLLGYDHERSPEDDEEQCSRQKEIMENIEI